MKNNFLYKLSLKIVPSMVYYLVSIWFKSCRVTIHGQKHIDQIGGEGIGAFWHHCFLYIIYHFRKESVVVMVSSSKDGEYISLLAERFGMKTVRGSKNKGGMAALKSLIRFTREGWNAALVADGSQGPARIAQAGTIMLASRTGQPILPILWSCNRYIRINSWDGTVIPYPFARIDLFYGEALEVPPKIKSDEFEQYRLILEERLNTMYVEAWKIQGKTEH